MSISRIVDSEASWDAEFWIVDLEASWDAELQKKNFKKLKKMQKDILSYLL